MNERTNDMVAQAASVRATMRLGGTQLIGLILSESPRALVRFSDGQVVKVGIGTRIGAGEVVAISEAGLTLVEGGAAKTLEMPT